MYNINLNALQQLAKLSPNNDIRQRLNGVHVIITGSESRYETTNGHYAVVYRNKFINPDNINCLDIIIPREVLIGIKLKKFFELATLSIENSKYEITYVDGSYGFTPIDDKYPDLNLILPDPLQVDCVHPGQQFNPNYLLSINKCYQAITNKKEAFMQVQYNKDPKRAALMIGGDDLIAVIMPLRSDNNLGVPDWYKQKPEQPNTGLMTIAA